MRLEAKHASQHLKGILEEDGRAIARRLGTDEEDKGIMPGGGGLAPKVTHRGVFVAEDQL